MSSASATSHLHHRILGHASSMLAYWDTDLVCRYATPSYERWFGNGRRAVVGSRFQDVLGEAHFNATHAHILAVLGGDTQVIESTMAGPDGIERRALARYHPDVVDAVVVGFVAEVADVASVHRLHRLERAVASAGLGVWEWDLRSGTVRLDNERARALFGAETGWIDTGVFCARYLHPDDADGFRSAMAAFALGGSDFYFQGRCAPGAGTVRWIECTGAMAQCNDRGARMAGTVADVTSRMATSQALLRAVAEMTEKETRRAEFLSIVGHELRNCVAPIAAGIQLFARGVDGAATQKIAGAMGRQLGHMERLIDDIHDLRRTPGGDLVLHRRPMSLNAVVETACDMVRPAMALAGHTFVSWLPDDDVWIDGDAVRLTQVLINLLGNAAKFTPANGDVSIALEVGPDRSMTILVRDNGVGLAPEQLEAAFGLYVRVGSANTGAAAGLGIGLYLARRLVQLHGGTLTASSPGIGRGCTMTVRLPPVRTHFATDRAVSA